MFMWAKVGNMESVSFWFNDWVRKDCLKFIFPYLFNLAKCKSVVVANRFVGDVSGSVWLWDWMLTPISNVELSRFQALNTLIKDFRFNQSNDRWVWEAEDDDRFTVKSLRHMWSVMESRPVDCNQIHRFNWIPRMVRGFIWKVRLNRIRCKSMLMMRGLD